MGKRVEAIGLDGLLEGLLIGGRGLGRIPEGKVPSA